MADENSYRLSKSEKEKEHWMNAKWRPMMGWMYMCICMFDFMIAPILWSLLQTRDHGMINSQWQPLTLQGAGLFHLAMGAVLGIAAHGRTQEKLNNANTSGMEFPSNAGTTYVPPGQQMGNGQYGTNNSFGNSQPSGFNNGSASTSFPSTPMGTNGFGSGFGNTPVATASPTVATTPIGSKARPAPQQDQAL